MKGFLPDQTRLTRVHLRTRNLERAVAFYGEVIGLKPAGAEAEPPPATTHVLLAASSKAPGLLELTEDPSAPGRSPRSIGLYHFALRYPSREALAQAYRRVLRSGYPIVGASDHGVSEAIYLSDPESNGIELYADRPRAQWRYAGGELDMNTAPLDLDALLDTTPAKLSPQAPAQPDLGHIHLHVASLEAAERFYGEFLGLTVTQHTYPGALFLAAGGYHHHIGVNIWAGKAAPPANSMGLVSYRLEVPVDEVLYCLAHRAPLLGYETRIEPQEGTSPILQIRDPIGNWLEVQPAPRALAPGPRARSTGCPGGIPGLKDLNRL